MKLFLDETDLKLLLEEKRELIGNRIPVDSLFAAIAFIFSAVSDSQNDFFGIPGLSIKTGLIIIGLWYLLKIVRDFALSIFKRYNHMKLFKDIKNLNRIHHEHSLICIRDTFSSPSTRFLLYDDERWDCKLFLNTKTIDYNNDTAIIDQISSWLNLDKNDIHCRYITSRVQEKYSVSHHENRIYNHRLYEVQIFSFPEEIRSEDFTIHDRHYYWMSIDEMEKDENILKKNLEVVDFVKEQFM